MAQKPQKTAAPVPFPPNDWDPAERGKARALARSQALNRFPEFTERCVTHGISLFDTETGACLLCLAEPSALPVRLHYHKAYAIAYPFECETHGEGLHDMRTNLCLRCFTVAGKPRTQGNRSAARIKARGSGATSYLATCDIHGLVPHHTVRGKCLTCFNSLGYPRKAAR